MKKWLVIVSLFSLLTLTACQSSTQDDFQVEDSDLQRNFYQIFVGSFYDSNQDGLGDLAGITEKLDYLNTGDEESTEDLKINGLWLTPIMPSPSYHKYDVVNYYEIDPEFGTMEDFETLIDEADQRDIGIIIDLVVNHSSSEHPWFQSALASFEEDATEEELKYRDYYNFSQEAQTGYTKLANGWYYESRFWSGMPDLNLANPEVRDEIKDISEFWLDKGVAGFRLDATSHFFENDTEKNVEFLDWFSTMVKEYDEQAYLVGEAWESNDIIEAFYASGIDSFFNFPMSQGSGLGDISETVKSQDGKRLGLKATQWNEIIKAQNPDAIDAVFLANHDNNRSAELFDTLEQKKMAASAYLLLPGNPFIYYGEEIGMTGSGIDENKRLPMMFNVSEEGQPNPPANATVSSETDGGTVEEQLANPDSLLSWYQRLLRIKANHTLIGRGEVQLIPTNPRSLTALSYTHEEHEVLVIHNFSQNDTVTFDLPESYEKLTIVDQLSINGEEGTINNQTVTVPPYSTLIVK